MKAKQVFKQKRSKTVLPKTAVPVWAAAGVLAMGGGASATAPATDIPSRDSGKSILLAEQEISDVSLGTFYVFDREREPICPAVRLAAGRWAAEAAAAEAMAAAAAAEAMVEAAEEAAAAVATWAAVWLAAVAQSRRLRRTPWRLRGLRLCPSWVQRLWRGCGFGLGLVIGGCGGCGGGCGTCWQWDPVLLHWVYVCY